MGLSSKIERRQREREERRRKRTGQSRKFAKEFGFTERRCAILEMSGGEERGEEDIL